MTMVSSSTSSASSSSSDASSAAVRTILFLIYVLLALRRLVRRSTVFSSSWIRSCCSLIAYIECRATQRFQLMQLLQQQVAQYVAATTGHIVAQLLLQQVLA